MEEAERRRQAERFVDAVLEACGAFPRDAGVGNRRAVLPEWLRRELQVDEALLYRAREGPAPPGVHVISPGTDLWERLLGCVRRRGRTGRFIVGGWLHPEELLNRLAGAPASGSPRETAGRILFHPEVVFTFRVSFSGGEPFSGGPADACESERLDSEELHSVVVDAWSEKILPPVCTEWLPFDTPRPAGSAPPHPPARRQVRRAGGCQGAQENEWLDPRHALRVMQAAAPPPMLPLARLYGLACEALDRRMVAPAVVKRLELAERTLRQENARLEAYYNALATEAVAPLRKLFRRIAAARVRIGLAGPRAGSLQAQIDQWEDEARLAEEQVRREMDELEAELQRRKEQAKDRFQVSARARLVACAWVWAPRVELQCPDGRTRLVDPVRNEELSFE